MIPTPKTLSSHANHDSEAPPPFRPASQFDDMFAFLEHTQSVEYPSRLGTFAVMAVRLGLPPQQHSAQRQWFADRLRISGKELKFTRGRIADLGRWVEFREETMHTPCSMLRLTLREDLSIWREVIQSWQAQRLDVSTKLALDELGLYERRVKGVEYIGQPSLEADDIKNMLWDVNLRVPDGGLPEDYPRTITMSQAITLGIVDLAWVRGYAWEDRTEMPADELGPTMPLAGDDEQQSSRILRCPDVDAWWRVALDNRPSTSLRRRGQPLQVLDIQAGPCPAAARAHQPVPTTPRRRVGDRTRAARDAGRGAACQGPSSGSGRHDAAAVDLGAEICSTVEAPILRL